MAFVCLLNEEPIVPLIVKRSQISTCVVVHIGYDDEEDFSYSLIVSLIVSLDELPGEIVDFTFFIVQFCGETNTEYPFYSSKEVASFIPSESRALILRHLLRSIPVLLRESRPEKIQLCTLEESAPYRANRKFIMIAQAFKLCGYEAKTADPYYGRRVWWMVRLTE